MEYYVHSSRPGRRRFSPVRFIAGILVLVFFVIGVKSFASVFLKQSSSILSPITSTLGSSTQDSKKVNIASLTQLESRVKELIETQKGSWSVYFVDYSTNQRFGINEQVVYRAASVNKLYILASLYFLAGKGEIDLDETVTLQASDIQDFGTGTIRYDPPGTVYSLKTLARLLTEKSDNTAEYLLKTRIGEGEIQQLVNQFGMRQTSIVDNKTSLSDLALLFEKMKNGEITTPVFTPEMIDLLDKSDFEDRLPALLPPDVRVYHKIGNEVGNTHDVGLIVKAKMVYFLGVLSSDIGDTEEEAKKTIAQISKLVFDFKTHK